LGDAGMGLINTTLADADADEAQSQPGPQNDGQAGALGDSGVLGQIMGRSA